MLLGVVSDTHGHLDYTRAAVELLARLDVEAVIHCGDIGGVQIPALFSAWPTHFVFGNVDRDAKRLQKAIEDAEQFCHGRFADIELAGRRIAVAHGDDRRRMFEAISGGRFDLVCYGHTHVPETHRDGHVVVLNPGAIFRANPHTLATVRLPELLVAHHQIAKDRTTTASN